jgi:hypothetical protein
MPVSGTPFGAETAQARGAQHEAGIAGRQGIETDREISFSKLGRQGQRQVLAIAQQHRAGGAELGESAVDGDQIGFTRPPKSLRD